jgi:hypothetical protein
MAEGLALIHSVVKIAGGIHDTVKDISDICERIKNQGKVKEFLDEVNFCVHLLMGVKEMFNHHLRVWLVADPLPSADRVRVLSSSLKQLTSTNCLHESNTLTSGRMIGKLA